MNRPAGTIAAWWANPVGFEPDTDVEYPSIPLPREWEARLLAEPFRSRMVRVMRKDLSALEAAAAKS